MLRSHVPNEQKEQIAAFLAHQRTGVISTTGKRGVWAMPVWYRLLEYTSNSQDLRLDCLVPRWADIAHELNRESRVLLVVQAGAGVGLRWLQIQGEVQPVPEPHWNRLLPRWISTLQPDRLYLVIRLTPERIDLIDEEVGWGVLETLEW